MKKIFINIIRFYQKIPGSCHLVCRFTPTCSNYMIEAIEIHGVLKGCFLGVIRILKCNPWGPSGYDPVPEKGKWK